MECVHVCMCVCYPIHHWWESKLVSTAAAEVSMKFLNRTKPITTILYTTPRHTLKEIPVSMLQIYLHIHDCYRVIHNREGMESV